MTECSARSPHVCALIFRGIPQELLEGLCKFIRLFDEGV